MRRLNWGCGPVLAEGWVNSDVLDYGNAPGHQDHVGAIDTGLPYPDGHFDYVVSHHALQMISWPDLLSALVELRRVLAPGGWLRLSVPDFEAAMAAWQRGATQWFPIDDRHERSVDGKFCMYVTQAGASRSVFTRAWLFELLQRVVFERIDGSSYGETRSGIADLVSLDSRPGESLFVDARR